MLNDIDESYFISDSLIHNREELNNFLKVNSLSIYEVIRVKDGIPLFLEQHMQRLKSSAGLLGYDIELIKHEIIDSIHKLILINNRPEKNIKIIINNLQNECLHYIAYFIKSAYPSLEQYENGVHTVTYSMQRKNPNAKVINTDFKSKVNEIMASKAAYEVILLNENNEITEGSRSNLFFIKDSTVYTSPLKDVLGGVTRTNVIAICKQVNIRLEETIIKESFLKEVDALFMTGTSPKVLPISSIGDRKYSSSNNAILINIKDAFDKYIDVYVNAHR